MSAQGGPRVVGMPEVEGPPLRLGIVGCGRIVERGYVPAALATAGVAIAALADPDEGRLGRCRDLWEAGGEAVRCFGDAADLIECGSVDAVVIAVPPAAHHEVAERAAAASLPSLVEKPPAADLAGAQGLAALDPTPQIAFNRRFLQGSSLAGAIPDTGWLELELELRYRRDAWAAHQVRDDALLDAGIHLIDLATFLSAAAPICVRHAVVEPERAGFELELGRARARVDCATDRRHRERVEVRDRAGRTLAQGREGGVRGRVASLRGAPHPLVLSIGRQLEAFRQAVAGQRGVLEPSNGNVNGATSLATAQDGVVAMAVVEAVRRSAELGGAEVTV